MAAELYSKMECPMCAGHIEFPFASSGRSVHCPHCGKHISLNAPGLTKAPSIEIDLSKQPNPKPQQAGSPNPFLSVAITGVIVVLAALFIGGVFLTKSQKADLSESLTSFEVGLEHGFTLAEMRQHVQRIQTLIRVKGIHSQASRDWETQAVLILSQWEWFNREIAKIDSPLEPPPFKISKKFLAATRDFRESL